MNIEERYLSEEKIPKNRIKGYKLQKNVRCCFTCRYGVYSDSFAEEYPCAWECEHPDNRFVDDEYDIVIQYVEQLGLCPLFKK